MTFLDRFRKAPAATPAPLTLEQMRAVEAAVCRNLPYWLDSEPLVRWRFHRGLVRVDRHELDAPCGADEERVVLARRHTVNDPWQWWASGTNHRGILARYQEDHRSRRTEVRGDADRATLRAGLEAARKAIATAPRAHDDPNVHCVLVDGVLEPIEAVWPWRGPARSDRDLSFAITDLHNDIIVSSMVMHPNEYWACYCADEMCALIDLVLDAHPAR